MGSGNPTGEVKCQAFSEAGMRANRRSVGAWRVVRGSLPKRASQRGDLDCKDNFMIDGSSKKGSSMHPYIDATQVSNYIGQRIRVVFAGDGGLSMTTDGALGYEAITFITPPSELLEWDPQSRQVRIQRLDDQGNAVGEPQWLSPLAVRLV